MKSKKTLKLGNLLPPYIPPRRTDAPWAIITSKNYATLVAPKLTKGIEVLQDIMPQLHKLSFKYHDTNKLRDMDRRNYMEMVKYTPDSPNSFTTMKWAKGLE